MRNLLALIGLLVVAVAGVGWYMGWYKLSVTRTSDGNLQINTTVDTKKAETDSATFFKQAATVVGSHIEKSTKDGGTGAPATTPAGTPGPAGAVPVSAFNPLAPAAPTAPTAPENSGTSPIKLVAPK